MKFNRRQTLGLGVAAFGLYFPLISAKAQLLLPVRLIVLRQPGTISNQCVAPCIRGLLYDVSSLAGFDMENLVLPAIKALPPICGVIERPFDDNKPDKSSIPRGVYSATIRDDATKKWMTTPDRRWRLELSGVPGGRSAIQFHFGKDVAWSTGCFIVGMPLESPKSFTREGYCNVAQSEQTMAKLRDIVTSPANNLGDIKIAVSDDGDLFPNLKGTPLC